MPKPSTNPYLYDHVLQLKISILKKYGYLNANTIKSGSFSWYRNGEKFSSLSIKVNTNQNVVELKYKAKDIPISYKITLVTIPSNLGKGLIWYFICPVTKKQCRNLYLIGNRFLHRNAFNYSMYECQTQSKKWRAIKKIYGVYFDYDEILEKLNEKHFKSSYNGKPTKRFLKLNAQYEKYAKLDHEDIEHLLVFGI